MGWLKAHLGEWISVHARAERVPPRLTVAVTVGELPEGWPRPRRGATVWAALVGAISIAPFILLLAATLLRTVGLVAPYQWLAASSPAILAATISLFIGIPVAIVINLWRIARVGVHRRGAALDGLIALEVAPLQLMVLVVAVVVGGLFVGHLAADSYACVNGVHSAC